MKDSGTRLEFDGGMVRDTTEGKINYMLIRPGPMLKRWAAHLSRAASKYDNTRAPGEPRNWQLARGLAEYERFVESAARHFEQWLNGDRDEDHAAAIFFNVNGAEYVLEQLQKDADDTPLKAVTLDEVGRVQPTEVRRMLVGEVFHRDGSAQCPWWFSGQIEGRCQLSVDHTGPHVPL